MLYFAVWESMKIRVDRFTSDSDSTVSLLSINGSFECFGLEDEFREEKVSKETRIPAGLYKVGVRTVGRFHKRYSNRFKNIHKGMLHILDVPNFTFILIHCGNTDEDTAGCLLVGTSAQSSQDNMSISSSKVAYMRFYPKVIAAAEAGDLEIEFVDSDQMLLA